MKNRRAFLLTLTAGLVAAVVIITPVIAEEFFGFITNVDVEGKKVTVVTKDGDEVVVVGHIGGDPNPWVEGRAAFWIVDPSIKPCPPGEGCKTPWDCCCLPKEDLLKAMATVKVVDDEGKTVPVDARKLLGVKESMTVVAHGIAKRDEKGNLTVLTDTLFVRP